MNTDTKIENRKAPWNKGKLVGQKLPLKLKEIWAIRIHLQLASRIRELDPPVDLTQYEAVGFHATSSLACAEIEQVGFLPHKILSQEHHSQILSMARRLSLDTSNYAEWLAVTGLADAERHAGQSDAGTLLFD